jgi:NADH-quinone oxidoreductase subunit J
MTQVFFFVLAAIAVISALLVVFNRNVVYSALALLTNFCTLAVFYFMLNAQFLGVAQILVYAGAIVVLFLFVVMLIGADLGEPVDIWLSPRNTIMIAFGLLLLTVIGTALFEGMISGQPGQVTNEVVADMGQTRVIARALFTDYVLPFQLVAVLLTVGVIGVVWLAQHQQRQKFRKIVAVLDAAWPRESERPGPDLLRVNWLRRKTLFDFDWIEIVRATDQDVADFTEQIQEDTDSWRRSRYRQMRVLVHPNLKLSDETVRALRDRFGEVKTLQPA